MNYRGAVAVLLTRKHYPHKDRWNLQLWPTRLGKVTEYAPHVVFHNLQNHFHLSNGVETTCQLKCIQRTWKSTETQSGHSKCTEDKWVGRSSAPALSHHALCLRAAAKMYVAMYTAEVMKSLRT